MYVYQWLNITKKNGKQAWIIRSILKTIIAFSPVREDHDDIGALGSSVENRKYYAKQSLKYKMWYIWSYLQIIKTYR